MHIFFTVELVTQRLLYPLFFCDSRPAQTPGALPLSVRRRWLLLAISAGVYPVASLLLLALVPAEPGQNPHAFALAVGGLAIALGVVRAAAGAPGDGAGRGHRAPARTSLARPGAPTRAAASRPACRRSCTAFSRSSPGKA